MINIEGEVWLSSPGNRSSLDYKEKLSGVMLKRKTMSVKNSREFSLNTFKFSPRTISEMEKIEVDIVFLQHTSILLRFEVVNKGKVLFETGGTFRQ